MQIFPPAKSPTLHTIHLTYLTYFQLRCIKGSLGGVSNHWLEYVLEMVEWTTEWNMEFLCTIEGTVSHLLSLSVRRQKSHLHSR